MSDRIELRDINTLVDLKAAFGRFSETVEDALRAIEAQLQQDRQRLLDSVERTRLQVEQYQKSLAQAEIALRACMACGDKDSRNCSAEARAVAYARERLAQAQQAFRTARRWQQTVENEIGKYRSGAQDLQNLAGDHTGRARARLGRLMAKYREAQAAALIVGTASNTGTGGVSSAAAPVTWAEQRALLERMDEGKQISAEEFGRLRQLASDLRYETIALEDQAWIARVIRSQEFYKLTRSLWMADGPGSDVLAKPALDGLISVLQELVGATLDVRDIVKFWEESA